MEGQAPEASYLAGLLRDHQDEITFAWAERVRRSPDSHYGHYTQDEVLTWLSRGVAAAIEALLLFKEATFPFIKHACLDGPLGFDAANAVLDTYLRSVVSRFGHLYAEAMERELRRSEERFRTLADFTYDWEYWLDPDGAYLYVSPSCERITGYRSDEFQQDPKLLETIIHTEVLPP